MHHISTLNWVAVLVAALSGFAVGSLWYRIFRAPWMRHSGMTFEKGAAANMPLTFGGAYVMNLIAAFALAVLLGDHAGWQSGVHVGIFAGFMFVCTALGVIYLFEQKPLGLWLINGGYQVVNFAVMGTILGAWPR